MAKSKLLEAVRNEIRIRHYSRRTEKSYVGWIKRFIIFHNKKHPGDLGEKEIQEYLNYLSLSQNVSYSTQNQALNAIIFLYKNIIKKKLGVFNFEKAKRVKHIPVVLSKNEVKSILSQLDGVNWLAVNLLYGAGLRVSECLRLRIKDIDFDYNQIMVHDGKGEKDRRTILPETLKDSLTKQISRVKILHDRDLKNGYGKTILPYALGRKYKNAPTEFKWQYLFPAPGLIFVPELNTKIRFHINQLNIQRAVKNAAASAEITKQVSPHTFRHLPREI